MTQPEQSYKEFIIEWLGKVDGLSCPCYPGRKSKRELLIDFADAQRQWFLDHLPKEINYIWDNGECSECGFASYNNERYTHICEIKDETIRDCRKILSDTI